MAQQDSKEIIFVKPKDSEREAISKMIDRALDSDYDVLVRLE